MTKKRCRKEEVAETDAERNLDLATREEDRRLTKKRCIDCEYRYAVGKSPRCNVCRKRRVRRQAHNTHLKATYGITIDEYDQLFESQDGTCWICDGGTSKRFLAVDHDHKTGEVRGLLCATCNKTLGKFRDNPERFDKAAAYLRTPPASTVLGRKAITP
jgi:hypothetical protein